MHLYTVDASQAGAQPAQLTTGKFELASAELSRDKRKFVIVSTEVHPGERHMYDLPIEGGPRTRLTTMTGSSVGEISPDGSFVVTKHEGTAGLVTVDTVAEQLVYEMGNPTGYITPDCVADFTSIRLAQEGKDRVRVSGIRGRPATDTFKVSVSYLEGYKAVGQLTVSGPDALAKARVCADAVWGRLRYAGCTFEERITEFVGVDACHGALARREDAPEVVLRLGVKDDDRQKVDRFGKEIAPLVTSGPPRVTGFAGGRPKATEVLAGVRAWDTAPDYNPGP